MLRAPILLPLALCVLACVGAAAPARAQGPPTELWKEYPLEQRAAPPASPTARPRVRAAPADDGGDPVELVVAALVVALIAVAALRYASRTPPMAERTREIALRPAVPTRPGRTRPRALGYTVVAGDGDEAWELLRDETRLIEAACTERGMTLGRVVREIDPEPDLSRPGLSYALERLAEGEFACLVVTRLDQLASSAAELAPVVRELRRRQMRLVVIEIDFDSAAMESELAAVALTRADRIEAAHGARPMRPAPTRGTLAEQPELRQRILDMRATGMSLQAIADTLNSEGVPTVRGGAKWRPSSLHGAVGYRRPQSRRH